MVRRSSPISAFLVCGIPNKTLLAFLVFILSMVPMGPPLVWVPVAIALYLKGEMGYAIFLALWGTFAVSSVDNFLKPMLISQGTPLPMALVFLGVFGGLLSFGFLGILLGPIFLSLGSCALHGLARAAGENRYRPVIGSSPGDASGRERNTAREGIVSL